jgi:DnaJ-domain-containing protein 1
MDAVVKQGQFEGRHLSDLSREQLADLLIELKEDQESVALLESYIDRNFNEDFSDHTTDQSSKDTGIFSRRDALDILELDDSASADEIRAAHRQLMKKYHPDHGGSAFMAAKLNEAKEFLLGK